ASLGGWGSSRKRKGFASFPRMLSFITPVSLPGYSLFLSQALSVNLLVSFLQDISHLLASTFKDLYTGDVIGADIEANWIKSQGGEDVYHEAFTEELQKVQIKRKYNCRLTEADRVEENIIQAQARARAEEERALNVLKVDLLHLSLVFCFTVVVASSFRWIVDNELLRKNHLTCPDDYITDKLPVTRAPKGNFYISRVQTAFSSPLKLQCLILHRGLCFSKKSNGSQEVAWKGSKCKAERERECAYLAQLEKRQNYLKNPRFFPPNTLHGGKSLVISQEKMEKIIAEMTVEIQNVTSTCQHVRLIPPSTSAFAIGPGKFPGKGGMIAPGMSCQYVVQFIPEYLADYEDYILVETQVSEPLLIQIQAKRPAPVLTLPRVIDCGSCLVGGIKVTLILCRNEGFSTGKFCIMPKKAWPPPNFRAVATAGFVTQDPFGIYPAVFELAPGQSTTVEVMFFPSSPEVSQQIYTIVCDNCQVNDVTVTGVGQLIALELLHVTGGESSPEPGEVTDGTAQHLIRFDPQNPHTTEEKNLVIRNSTHVELPFYWQIIKPNLQPSVPEEAADFTKIEYKRDTESAFSLNPEQGVLLPHADHEFTLTYAPQELKTYHSVIQMVLRDIPESPSHVLPDVIALEVEVKGSTEPFQLLLEPYAIIIPGESFISVNVRKTFKMWNNSKSLIKYTWEKIAACDIVEVEPHTGVIDMNKCCEFELTITGGKPGRVSHNLPCKIEHSPEPVVLHVEAAFKGPFLCIDVPSLQLGLIKWGESVLRTFEIKNLCQLPARWRMQESQVCLAERNEEVSPFTIQPSAGEIPPLGTCSVSVQFTSVLCQRLQTILELEVENGEGSHLPVFVEVQTPQACLMSSHLALTEIYTGISVKATSKLFNQTLLPAKYLWGKLIGSQAAFCSAAVSPASGTLGPNEEKEFCIELMTNITVSLKTDAILSKQKYRTDVLILIFSYSDGRQILQSPCDLLLDFGSEVTFKDIVKRQLILTNHTGISAPFKLEAEYFTGYSAALEEICLSSGCLVKRRGPITKHAAKRAQSGMRNNSLLSHGKGVAFHVQPSSGTLKAFQQLIIEITAHNNMWGEYRDDLVCKVGGQVSPLRFGSHVSGGCPVFRSVRLNNPTPFDIRLDWEIYNQVKDDKKLVDLLMFFGDPFPPKDMDKNETASTGSNSESEIAEEITQEPTVQKIVSVLIRPHEGVAANNPYSITPRQIVVPGGGSISVCISFTPHVLPESGTEAQCGGFVLGFMIDMAHDGGMMFYSMASDLIPDQPLSGVLTDSVMTQSLKLINCTKVPLYFRLLLSTPFSLASTDLKKSTKTSHSKKEETEQQPQLVLYPQQNMLVKVSFHTTLELLTYQHLPDTQMLPGFQVLQFENGERKLKFSQNLVIEHSNHSTQLVPVTAYLTVPVLELSCDMLDFKTCFVAQTKTEHVFLSNRSGCRSYWTALLGIWERHNNDLEVFSVSPPNGILEAREGDQPTKDVLQITFTARYTVVTITGMLGEKPCKLQLRGRGSYDGKYEDLHLI
uniref:DLEC1 cilia and flagella associated protein n=1 Tax=Anser brachyrhynchus TaxID=132585 RepID=A0A8B9CT20_9AVES